MKKEYAKYIEVHGVTESIAFCEAMGFGKCFIAYAENAAHEEIMSVGFNCCSGYTYICLENGVDICSMLGRDVEYMTTNPEDGEEEFFDSYAEALAHRNQSTTDGGNN